MSPVSILPLPPLYAASTKEILFRRLLHGVEQQLTACLLEQDDQLASAAAQGRSTSSQQDRQESNADRTIASGTQSQAHFSIAAAKLKHVNMHAWSGVPICLSWTSCDGFGGLSTADPLLISSLVKPECTV
jgi:hypothetical protein